ncbi:MAG: hypothetical protein AAGI37_12305 [Planctomycetota bacterium]
MVDDRYRYTRYADGSEELYDRVNDPHGFENMIQQVGTDTDLAAIVKRLSQWIPQDEAGKPDLVDGRVKQ